MTNFPPWYQQCLDNIHSIGGTPCDIDDCMNGLNPYMHKVCWCLPPFTNGCTGTPPQPGCCAYTVSSPVPIFSPTGACYCCCGFAGSMRGMVRLAPGIERLAADVTAGDTIRAAGADLAWTQHEVAFRSEGMASSEGAVIRISFGSDPVRSIVCDPAQYLFIHGALVRADRLEVGRDALVVGESGRREVVKQMEAGFGQSGVHGVATSVSAATSLDAHLIIVDDVVAADYALHLGLEYGTLRTTLLAPEHDDRPAFGTPAYLSTYATLAGDNTVAFLPENTRDRNLPPGFIPINQTHAPGHASRLLSDTAASEILSNPAFDAASPLSNRGVDALRHLFRMYSGFYPYCDFQLARNDLTPNASSYLDDAGGAHIIVNFGLLLARELQVEGLAVVIAHELGHVYGGDRRDECASEERADLAAVASIIPHVWLAEFATVTLDRGLAQLEALLILAPSANGRRRIAALQAARYTASGSGQR